MPRSPKQFNITEELRAAFFWSSIKKPERDQIKEAGSYSPADILKHAPMDKFDVETLKEQGLKKNFSENLSHHLAVRVANLLRPTFSNILPDETGQGRESKARTARKYKKLDINYSTAQLGLGLGVSIKTVNSRDGKSKRFNKNFTRIDGELRAEAADYHERQPYAVLVAILFLPEDACSDQTKRVPSSFGIAARDFRFRSGRIDPNDSVMLFERFYIGVYRTSDDSFGDVIFFDVRNAPPKSGLPSKGTITVGQLVEDMIAVYNERNNPPFEWDSGEIEDVAQNAEDEDDDDDQDS